MLNKYVFLAGPLFTMLVSAMHLEAASELLQQTSYVQDVQNDSALQEMLEIVESKRGRAQDGVCPLAIDDEPACYERCYATDNCTPSWAFNVTTRYSFTDGSYDACSQHAQLSGLIFGDAVQLRDIYLFAKLCDDNKVRVDNVPARAPLRGNVPVGTQGVVFGGFRNDLYTTLMAKSLLQFSMQSYEVGADFTFMHRFVWCDEQRIVPVLGFTFPIKSKLHEMDLDILGDSLFRQTSYSPDNTHRQDSAKQFFRSYADVYDFVISEVFGAKGLFFDKSARKTGVGDITLFGHLDFAPCENMYNTFQLGLAIVVPSGGTANDAILWPPVLGNGGATQVDLYMHFIADTGCNVFNPSLRFAVEFSGPFKQYRRAIQRKTNGSSTRQRVASVRGLLAPGNFESFVVDPFDTDDSIVSLFGDASVRVKTRYGTKVLLGLGNYFYEAFYRKLRLGIFYEYMHKRSDVISCDNGSVDTAAFSSNTNAFAHTLSWTLVYKNNDGMLEVGIGSQHIVAGANMPREHEGFLTVTVLF